MVSDLLGRGDGGGVGAVDGDAEGSRRFLPETKCEFQTETESRVVLSRAVVTFRTQVLSELV